LAKTKNIRAGHKKNKVEESHFKDKISSAQKDVTTKDTLPISDYKRKTPDSTSDSTKKEQVVSHALTKQPVEKKAFVDTYELPSHYNATRLTLIPKDPHWIFAYWDIAPSSLSALRDKIGDEIDRSRMVLRMYDITYINFNGNNANRTFDLEVGSNANNWYINLWDDNVSYCGEIGMRASDGRFFSLVRSNYIHVPRVTYSPRTEQIWMKVTDEAKENPYVFGKANESNPSSNPKRSLNRQYVSPRQGRKISLSDEEIKRYYSRLTPLLRTVISHRLAVLYSSDLKEIILEGEATEEIKRIYDWLPKGTFVKKVLIGSSESLVMPGASEQLVQGASEFLHKKKEDKFFFEIGTELIVYGRTEPDAEVWLGNKKIELRNDGTFGLRYFLPDGKIPLEFTAISKNKMHKRKITTIVERKTTENS
jgi:hypothetical protein